MIWPPVKAWTSKYSIDSQIHFVAINYGGKGLERWVILMSVLDSRVVVKVSWLQLINTSNWQCGWDENNYLDSPELFRYQNEFKDTKYTNPSDDSGLTIPITKNIIRPWFADI